jgi:UDP-glucose 4-epimerase
MKSTILVTGGAGYIGSHAVLALKNQGYEVIILDNLVYGHQDLVENALKVKLIIGDIKDTRLLEKIFSDYQIEGVMHFCAYTYVGESATNPAKYYQNNVVATLNLLETMIKANIKKFVFSSTCATYGIPQKLPLTEDHPQNPINTYGKTKLMVEEIIKDFDLAYGLKSVIFRYFNAAGAQPEGLLGEDHDPETHLIPLILLTALKKRAYIEIFGTDYDTPDGTCIRDYIHVNDLADAHILGLEYLLQGGETDSFNLGNGNGFSVKEVIETAKNVTQKEIKIVESPRRIGDPPILVGSSQKAKQILNWQPQYGDINTIIRHAWQWHQFRHQAK